MGGTVSQRVAVKPRRPVKEEREIMYQAGFDPMECMVVSRLNGIMTICTRTVPSETCRIREATRTVMP